LKVKKQKNLITLTTIEDASRIPDKKSQYTAILREDGTIIDDTIFLHLDDKYMMMPNAGMGDIVTNWLNQKAEEKDICASTENVSDDFAIFAVQGPKSRDTLQKLTNTDLKTVGFFGCQYIDIAGIPCIISHTGYTGELGFELNIKIKNAERIWDEIMKAGQEFEIKPIGLGARDTLRLEKCFLLAGNEFEGGRTPLEATMGWAINWDHDFIGKTALLKQKEKEDYQRLTCLVCEEKGIPRNGCEIQKTGKKVGIVTSGTLSPCLNKGIAMGYVHSEYRDKDSTLDIMIRDKPIKTKVVKPPFVPKNWREEN